LIALQERGSIPREQLAYNPLDRSAFFRETITLMEVRSALAVEVEGSEESALCNNGLGGTLQ
jgi:hypothetical protein